MSQERNISLTVTQAGRLDKALAAAADGLEGLSRARLQQLIKTGRVSHQGRTLDDPSAKIEAGAELALCLPPPIKAEPEAQPIALTIVFEDDDLLVLDKPAGLVVHPAAGHRDGTLVNALLAHCGEGLSGIGGVARPGIVHRLDKDTSGLMVVAKNDFAHQALSAQFADRSLSRTYSALVWGLPTPISGEIEGAIGRHPRARQKMAVVTRGGKAALTFYKVLEVFGPLASLVSCKLATGRTHQIRVHMAHCGHPVVGDPLYGTRKKTDKNASKTSLALLTGFDRQALHAGEIAFIHPRSGHKMRFQAPLPQDMQDLLDRLAQTTPSK